MAGRLAQLVERVGYIHVVTGSSPVSPINGENKMWTSILIIFGLLTMIGMIYYQGYRDGKVEGKIEILKRYEEDYVIIQNGEGNYIKVRHGV